MIITTRGSMMTVAGDDIKEISDYLADRGFSGEICGGKFRCQFNPLLYVALKESPFYNKEEEGIDPFCV